MSKVMKSAMAGLVAVHFAVTVWHGNAHERLAVTLPPEKDAFVIIVIVLAPILAALLVWTRYAGVGTWIFFLSMLASFLFGAYHHYVLVSADHIRHLPGGSADAQSAFVSSAAATALLELASAVYGLFCLRRLRATAPVGRGQ